MIISPKTTIANRKIAKAMRTSISVMARRPDASPLRLRVGLMVQGRTGAEVTRRRLIANRISSRGSRRCSAGGHAACQGAQLQRNRPRRGRTEHQLHILIRGAVRKKHGQGG